MADEIIVIDKTEKRRLYNKQWYEDHKEMARASARRQQYANHLHNLARTKEYHQNHREEARARSRKWRANIKVEVLTHYGLGRCACVRCGFNDIRALSIDHIDGGGYRYRTKGQLDGTRGTSFYQQLKKRDFPLGFQTLCMNCNFTKRKENKEYGERTDNRNR